MVVRIASSLVADRLGPVGDEAREPGSNELVENGIDGLAAHPPVRAPEPAVELRHRGVVRGATKPGEDGHALAGHAKAGLGQLAPERFGQRAGPVSLRFHDL